MQLTHYPPLPFYLAILKLVPIYRLRGNVFWRSTYNYDEMKGTFTAVLKQMQQDDNAWLIGSMYICTIWCIHVILYNRSFKDGPPRPTSSVIEKGINHCRCVAEYSECGSMRKESDIGRFIGTSLLHISIQAMWHWTGFAVVIVHRKREMRAQMPWGLLVVPEN